MPRRAAVRRWLRIVPWLVCLWLWMPSVAEARSPVWGEPYRRGIDVELSVGPNFCLQPGIGGGQCDPEHSTRVTPGFALHLAGGYRLNRHVMLGAGFDRRGLGSGTTTTGFEMFSELSRIAVLGVVRGILPVGNGEFGLEAGIGWSRQTAVPNTSQIGPHWSDGFALRPAIVYDHWLIADFFIGIEVAALFHLHTRFCGDAGCASDLGAIPHWYHDTFTHDFNVSLRTGVVFSLTP